uniref:Zeaxanthin epoxidase, chloroplastic n=1 Tax=Chlamydomonas sp. (strain W80) TaxID=103365 RepID=Q84U72_CHLSW|nr:zeaxanthin epoxidase precursor [Chlamydomonas sp. W80]
MHARSSLGPRARAGARAPAVCHVAALAACRPAASTPPQPLCATISNSAGSARAAIMPQQGRGLGSGLVRCPTTPVATRASSVASAPASQPPAADSMKRPLRVLIAGAGIGGLVLAVALIKKGFHVTVFERDMTAIRGEGKYRGPIQIQSNALGALEAIDPSIADEVMDEGCITGDRVNGLCDGVTGDWYVKFDTFHPAVSKGLPVTRVISRVTLQNILAKAVLRYGGPDTIMSNSHVVGFEESNNGVSVTLENGDVHRGDILVGADGIWSKIRKAILGETEANYSQYTCYTGISDFTPADIDIVGYRVFLGNSQYFVSSDVGGGKMQWYGFHKEPAGGTDPEGQRKARLLDIFGHWNDNVVDLIKATPEEDIMRRDIFDRPPVFKWSEGRTVLLGDSVHAMQPNLGQGGCMAIEDAYELANNLSDGMDAAGQQPAHLDVKKAFSTYQSHRMIRASAIHGMAGMAAFMASTYKAYLGEGLPGPLQQLTKLKIHHPGRVVGRLVMNLTMPQVLGWVLGGNTENLDKSRVGHCRIADQPKAFHESQFSYLMENDEAIIQSSHADWMLMTSREAGSGSSDSNARVDATADATSTSECKGIYIGDEPSIIGRKSESADLSINDGQVAPQHARVWRTETSSVSGRDVVAYEYHVQDLGSDAGTWLNGRPMPRGGTCQLHAGDVLEFGQSPSKEVYRVKMQHVSLRNDKLNGHAFTTLVVGAHEGHGDKHMIMA